MNLPGFRRARRYLGVDATTRPKYIATYECGALTDLTDPGYIALLGDQSVWSKKIMAQFSWFERFTCAITIDHAHGMGGALSMIRRVMPAADAAVALRRRLAEALAEAARRPDVCGTWLAENDLDAANAPLRHQGKPVPEGQRVEWLVFVEGSTPEATHAAADAVRADIGPLLTEAPELLTYRFTFGNHR